MEEITKKANINKMVIFATLFKGEMGGIKDILVLLGKEREVKELDAEYQRKKFFGPLGLKELAKLYQGISLEKLSELSLYYCWRNLVKGLREISADLKNKGALVGALSSNPQFMMDVAREILELDFASGTKLEFKKGIATGRILKELNRYAKADILRKMRENYGLDKRNVIMIGRPTITHLPEAKEAGIFIGFDPEKESIDDIARIITTNLQEIKPEKIDDESYGNRKNLEKINSGKGEKGKK